MPKYTFLLPAYKVSRLDTMLYSIQGQTYKDYQVLISDDCSPEAIIEICRPYLSDPRFAYRRNKSNISGEHLVKHWNLLVDMCDTEYLILASDDDVYEPNFLEEIDKLVQKYPDASLFRSRVQKIDNTGEVIEEEGMFAEYESQLQFLNSYQSPSHIRCISNYVFKTLPLKEVGKFVDFPFACFSDTVAVTLMSSKGICHTKDYLFRFRWSGENLSSVQNPIVSKGKCRATLMYFHWMKDFMSHTQYEKSRLNDNLHQSIEHAWRKHALWHARTTLSALSVKEFRDIYNFFVKENMLPRLLMKAELVFDFINQKRRHG